MLPDRPTIPSIENTFSYHAPGGTQVERYQAIRDQAKKLAYSIHFNCPPSREASLAMTHLQTAVMYANAAIAINENVQLLSAVDSSAPAPNERTPFPCF